MLSQNNSKNFPNFCRQRTCYINIDNIRFCNVKVYVLYFQKSSEGQLVFDKVTKHLDVIETDYFGLTFRDKSGKKVRKLEWLKTK